MSDATTLGEEQRAAILRPPGIRSGGKPVFIGFGAVLLVLAALPFYPDIKFYYLQVVILVFFFAVVGTAWGILGGYSGQHSVAHAAFIGVGAYTSTLLYIDYGISPWLGMIVAMVLVGAIAIIIGYPTFRLGLRGDYFTLATVALGLFAHEIAVGWSGLTRGSQGIPIPYRPGILNFQFANREVYYYIAMVLWIVTVIISYRLRRSRLGFRMLAVRDDEAAAARGGINVLRTQLTSLVMSAVLTVAAGTFYAQFFLFIDPDAVMSLPLAVQIILVSALGGMYSYLGATVGALILVPIGEVLAVQLSGFPGADLALYGVALVLIMMYMPFGILGLLRKSPRWRRVIGW